MSSTEGPIYPFRDQSFDARNPFLGSGNVVSQAVVIKNVSSYILEVASGTGKLLTIVDPFTTDLVSLGGDVSQELTITPRSQGFINLQTVIPAIYLTWYQDGEEIPGAYPYGVGGASQLQVSGLSTASADIVGASSALLLPSPPPNMAYRLQSITAVSDSSVAGLQLQLLLESVLVTSFEAFAIVGFGVDWAEVSIDLLTWGNQTLPEIANWAAIIYANGTFLAVASGSDFAATSPDGGAWTARTLPVSATWAALAYGAGVFVAIALYSSDAASSPDAATWTLRSLPSVEPWTLLAFGAGVFLAIANGAPAASAAATTPDGITWTARALPMSAAWIALAFGAGLFVAVISSSNSYVTSPDGITFTTRALPVSAQWTSLTYANGTFVLVSDGDISLASPDGITWTAGTLPVSTTWSSVAFAAGYFVAVAGNGTYSYAAATPDGIHWTELSPPGSLNAPSIAAGSWTTTATSILTGLKSAVGEALVDSFSLNGVLVSDELDAVAGPAGNTATTRVFLSYDLVEI